DPPADPVVQERPRLLRPGGPRALAAGGARPGGERSAGGGDPDRILEPADEEGTAVRHDALVRGDRRPFERARRRGRGEGDEGLDGAVARGRRTAHAPGAPAAPPAGLAPVALPAVPRSAAPLSGRGEAGAPGPHHRRGRPRAGQGSLVAAHPAQPAGAGPPAPPPRGGGGPGGGGG